MQNNDNFKLRYAECAHVHAQTYTHTHTHTQISPKNLTEVIKEEKKIKIDALKP